MIGETTGQPFSGLLTVRREAAALLQPDLPFVNWQRIAERQIAAPYRQLNAVPVLSFFLALGAVALSAFLFSRIGPRQPHFPRAVAMGAIVLISLASAPSYWQLLAAESNRPAHPFAWTLAKEIRQRSSPQDRLVMIGKFDTKVGGNDPSPVTYYYPGLRAWRLELRDWSCGPVETLIWLGATLFAVTREFGLADLAHDSALGRFVEQVKSRYPVLSEKDGWLLVRLAR